MRRLTLEATDENVLNSIKENNYNRNQDIKDFIKVLDEIEGNMFISLDARWGDGKTFYVRQIEKTLEYLTKRDWVGNNVENYKQYFDKTILNSIQLKQSYFPVYYNAWLYDNHDDPLMSLLLTIIKKSEIYLNTKLQGSIGEKISTLLSATSVSFSNGVLQGGLNIDGIQTNFCGRDILENVKTAEQIRELVKEILNDIIVEKAERLLIFVDELDRCRPSFAIEMLERIKHYFDDERLIFIVSVNKEQLIHTISKCYGYGIDSTGYLNKFFDLNTHMPLVDTMNREDCIFESYNDNQYWFSNIANGLNDYYKLTLRDSLIYKQRISDFPIGFLNDRTPEGISLSLFIPILIILDIKDQNEKAKFINGKSKILDILSIEVPAIRKLMCRFGEGDINESFQNGLNKFKSTYGFIFDELGRESYIEHTLQVSHGLKGICIKVVNGFLNKYEGQRV